MKNSFNKILLPLILMFLVGCNSNKESESISDIASEKVDFSSLKILSPQGAPAVAFYNYSDNNNYTTNATPSNIVASMSEKSDIDVVVIDTVSGIKAINNGAPYKMAATITFGNFYIAATGNDDNSVMDNDDTIVLFGQNQTPDYIFNYLYGTENFSNIEYVTAVSDAAKCLITGKNSVTGSTVDYVFVAQPVLYNALNNKNAATYGKASVYKDIQKEYEEKSNNKKMIQASVFVKTTDTSSEYTAKIDAFLNSLEKDINAVISNPELVVNGFNKVSSEEATAKYSIPGMVAKAVLSENNGLGLGYQKALTIKDQIDAFINLFGQKVTNENIYY